VLPVAQANEIAGLQVSPVVLVEETKLRVIHDLTFGSGATVRKGRGSKELGEAKETRGMSMNVDTDWKRVPDCRLSRSITEIITRILGFRKMLGQGNVFWQVGVAPDSATVFAYRSEDLRFVDLCLQFGWCGILGWCAVIATAFQEARRVMTWASVGSSAAADEVTSDVDVSRLREKGMELLLPGCRVPRVQGRGEIYSTWVIFFVGDAIPVEVQWKQDGARFKALTASLADAHFR